MNALPITFDEPVIDRSYRYSISIHCPNSNEMEMAARVDLAKMRDAAMIGVSRATDSASVILAEVVKLAAYAVFSPMSASQLIRVKAALSFTMEAARAVDMVCQDG